MIIHFKMKLIYFLLILNVLLLRIENVKSKKKEKPKKGCRSRAQQIIYEDEFDDIEKKGKEEWQMGVEEVEYRIRKKGTMTLGLVKVEENLSDLDNRFYNITEQTPYFNFNQLLMMGQNITKGFNPYTIGKKVLKDKKFKGPKKNKNTIYSADEMMKKNLFFLE